MDPDLQADDRGRAQPRRVEVHPQQRPPARPHGRRPARPDGVRRSRFPAPARPVRRATGSTTSRSSADEIVRALGGGHADEHRGRCRPAPTAPTPSSTSPTAAASRSPARVTGRQRARRDHRRLRRHVGRQPVRHQRGQELTHAYTTFAIRSVLEPGAAEQLRQPRSDQGRGARSARSSTPVSPSAGHRPPRGRHVPAQRASQGAGPDQAGPVDGRGLRRRVDDAGERQPPRRQPVHHGDVHLRRRCRSPGQQARPVGGVVPDRRVGRCRSRWSRRRRRSTPAARSCARAVAARASRPGASARRSSSPSTPRSRGSCNAVTSRLAVPPEGIFGGEARQSGSVHRQRRGGHDPGPRHAASPATRCASTCPVAAEYASASSEA